MGFREPLERIQPYRNPHAGGIIPWGVTSLPRAVQPSVGAKNGRERDAALAGRQRSMTPLLPRIPHRVHLRDRCSRRPIRTKNEERSIAFGSRFASRANELSARVRSRGPKGAISLRHRRRFTFVHRVGKGIPGAREAPARAARAWERSHVNCERLICFGKSWMAVGGPESEMM